ncbi:MAG: hypothetical protein ACRDMV_04930 [Streptosporangiales bacterium]
MKLPKAAQNLLDTVIAHGWSYAVMWARDSGNCPFVNVKIADSEHEFHLTWHTRDTGTLRLFGRNLDRRRDRYVSLSTVLDTVTANPQEWVLEVSS